MMKMTSGLMGMLLVAACGNAMADAAMNVHITGNIDSSSCTVAADDVDFGVVSDNDINTKKAGTALLINCPANVQMSSLTISGTPSAAGTDRFALAQPMEPADPDSDIAFNMTVGKALSNEWPAALKGKAVTADNSNGYDLLSGLNAVSIAAGVESDLPLELTLVDGKAGGTDFRGEAFNTPIDVAIAY